MSEMKLKFKNAGFEQIYMEVIQKINLEAEKIIESGLIKANKLKKEMEKEIDGEVEGILNKARKIAKSRKNKLISSNEIEIKRINLLKRNEFIQKSIDQAIKELKTFQLNNLDYKKYLLNFIKQGIETVYSFKKSQLENKMDEINKFLCEMKISSQIQTDEIDIIIQVNERDKQILTKNEIINLISNYKISIDFKINNDIIGGAIISTSDETVILNNTFMERLNSKKLSIIEKISDIFWV